MSRRKNGALALGVTAVLASALLTGCTPDGTEIDADYAKVCQEKSSELRVDDSKCSEEGRSGGAYGWYFYHMVNNNPNIAPVGSKLSGGSTTAPSSGSVKSGVTPKGGVVARGGFGTSAKSGTSNGG